MILPMWLHRFTGRIRSRVALKRRWLFSSYKEDGLQTIHDNSFLDDPAFRRAYNRGVQAACHDYQWHWRVHMALWVAASASKLEGDFVECGVNKGFMSSAVMAYLDWDGLGKTFFLVDTFSGLSLTDVSEQEIKDGALKRNAWWLKNGFYITGVESVRENFSEWRQAIIVEGAVPGVLDQISAESVAFLHLDMNSALPERAALEYLWPRLVSGAFVLMDDYGFRGHQEQKNSMDEFAHDHLVKIASLPTGQGLLIKP
jgi:hypothetical protein